MTEDPTNDSVFNKPISKTSRSAPDFVSLERFTEITGISKDRMKWHISKRDNNGANFFLHKLGHKEEWFLSLSLFYEWNERRMKQRKKQREKIKTGETNE